MNSDIMTSIESGQKFLWIKEYVTTDHEMSCCLIIILQKLHKDGGILIF